MDTGKQRYENAFRIFKPGGKQPSSTVKASSASKQDSAPTSATWIDHNALVDDQSRKSIRAQAARASAAARRATIAKKQAKKLQQPGSGVLTFAKATAVAGEQPRPADFARDINKAVAAASSKASPDNIKSDQAFFQRLIAVVTPLLERRPLSLEQPGEVSLAHTSIRMMMWDAMTSSTTLFQVATFVAGTHSNTCGLHRSAFVHMGPGLVALRGASMDAIQTQISSSEAESVAPVSIALLAGWERRYGDMESYAVHMRAWKALPLPTQSLEENSIATLTDMALEMYRLSLDERSTMQASADAVNPSTSLPVGFRQVMSTKWPEARSLLAIVAHTARHDPKARDEVARLRKLGLENMAWSPTHTRTYEAQPELEDQIDPLELSALYHIRAANIPIIGYMLKATMAAHNMNWPFDLDSALWIHTSSCVHLKTEALMDTEYQDIALWAKFTLCATARDPSQDSDLAQLLDRSGITTWKSLKARLEGLLYHEMFDTRFSAFFDVVMEAERPSRKPVLNTGYDNMGDLLK